MNVFLPYPKDIAKSVACLDDRRLIKQILECRQIIVNSMKNEFPIEDHSRGYSNHPVVKHYKNQRDFIATYGSICCMEYTRRFSKKHSYDQFFSRITSKIPIKAKEGFCEGEGFSPLYVSGSFPYNEYTTDPIEVAVLFRNKLLYKWASDREKKHAPKWTNCQDGEVVIEGDVDGNCL